jgi:hypothetical protein
MRDELFSEFNQVTYFRIKGRRRIAKQISRNRKHAFFAAVHSRQLEENFSLIP